MAAARKIVVEMARNRYNRKSSLELGLVAMGILLPFEN